MHLFEVAQATGNLFWAFGAVLIPACVLLMLTATYFLARRCVAKEEEEDSEEVESQKVEAVSIEAKTFIKQSQHHQQQHRQQNQQQQFQAKKQP